MIFDLHVNQSLVGNDELMQFARAIDGGPFHTLWVLDHFASLQEDAQHAMLDPFVLLGALATQTKTVNIGVLVANVVNRLPAVLAQAATSLQYMSNNRFSLGLGAGAAPTSQFAAEHHSLGIGLQAKMSDRHAHLQNSVQAIRAFWRRGKDETPRIVQPSTEPPITIGVNSARLAELAAQMNCAVNIRWNHEDLTSILAAYQNEARKCNTQSNISIWMPWETQHTNNPSYLESFSELGVDRVIFLTTQAQHFTEIKKLGNFSFP
jgi:alkanesulfonate monooxygenase SsuD/methylene tetrahydromethanopterin reductase-like flavin-dependent oxidoreductase (luciferase family)